MKKVLTVLLILIMCTTGYSAQSRILTWLGSTYKKLGLPTFTEYAWVVNLINILDQSATFVRSTNQLLKSYQRTYYEQKALITKCQDTWAKCERLFSDIDPYDMDTWADVLYRADNIINWDCENILYSLKIMDMNTFGACSTFVTSFSNEYCYDEALLKNEYTVTKVYTANDYDTLHLAYCNTYENYRNSTISTLRASLNAETYIFNYPKSSPVQKETAKKRMAELRKKIAELEKNSSTSNLHKNHTDTIIELTSSLISYNMTEMQIIEEQISEFEKAALVLVAKYNDLSENNVTAEEADKIGNDSEPVEFNDTSIYGTEADKVPVPTKPENIIASKLKGKSTSNHDILNLQNAIAFIALRQEALIRDLVILKAKTMAMITAQEAYARELNEQRALHIAHQSQMLYVSMEQHK